MRYSNPVLALAAATLLGGCVFDPYTNSYEPCCAYGYPAGYPAYEYPADPSAAPPPGQPGPYEAPPTERPPAPPGAGAYASPPPGQPPGAPDFAGHAPFTGRLAQRFAAANVTHDGRLTREQAAAAMPNIARQFDAIDTGHKGYVTLDDIRAFIARRRMQGAQPG